MAKAIKGNIIYLHIPKTGGNWLTKILDDNDLVEGSIANKHADYSFVSGFIQGEKTNLKFWKRPVVRPNTDYSFFCVVRNPLTWYESWFKYQKSKGFRNWGENGNLYRWHPAAPINGASSEDFNSFVMQILSKEPGFVTDLYGRFAASSAVSVLKNETIREDFLAFAKQNGIPLDENSVVNSPRFGQSPPEEIVWEKDVFEKVVDVEAGAFRKYNYETEGVVKVR